MNEYIRTYNLKKVYEDFAGRFAELVKKVNTTKRFLDANTSSIHSSVYLADKKSLWLSEKERASFAEDYVTIHVSIDRSKNERRTIGWRYSQAEYGTTAYVEIISEGAVFRFTERALNMYLHCSNRPFSSNGSPLSFLFMDAKSIGRTETTSKNPCNEILLSPMHVFPPIHISPSYASLASRLVSVQPMQKSTAQINYLSNLNKTQ